MRDVEQTDVEYLAKLHVTRCKLLRPVALHLHEWRNVKNSSCISCIIALKRCLYVSVMHRYNPESGEGIGSMLTDDPAVTSLDVSLSSRTRYLSSYRPIEITFSGLPSLFSLI